MAARGGFAKAAQRLAEVYDLYEVMPRIVGTYRMLPQPGTTHALGLPRNVPDQRFPELLPNGPFQITKHVGYEESVGDPVHRFFHMWQQVDGGRRDLFVWVADMASGDAPYFRELADTYALSDNHHQPVMGGTGANFQALGTGYAIAYWEEGALAKPPPNQIENPNPRDAFGDGTRIPLIAVSPFAKKGAVGHTYTDHVSMLKFIEVNWRLDPLSPRSSDHLPNPIGDLTSLVAF